MGIWQELKDLFVLRSKRRRERIKHQTLLRMKAVVEGHPFAIIDHSLLGIAFRNDSGFRFQAKAVHHCLLTLNNVPRASIQFRVVRVDGATIGCEPVDQAQFQKFLDNNLVLAETLTTR